MARSTCACGRSTEEERQDLLKAFTEQELERIYSTNDLVVGESALFCATGISDSQLLPGVKFVGNTATTLLNPHARTQPNRPLYPRRS